MISLIKTLPFALIHACLISAQTNINATYNLTGQVKEGDVYEHCGAITMTWSMNPFIIDINNNGLVVLVASQGVPVYGTDGKEINRNGGRFNVDNVDMRNLKAVAQVSGLTGPLGRQINLLNGCKNCSYEIEVFSGQTLLTTLKTPKFTMKPKEGNLFYDQTKDGGKNCTQDANGGYYGNNYGNSYGNSSTTINGDDYGNSYGNSSTTNFGDGYGNSNNYGNSSTTINGNGYGNSNNYGNSSATNYGSVAAASSDDDTANGSTATNLSVYASAVVLLLNVYLF